MITVVMFLDFCKAFDVCSHHLLLYKLWEIGLRGKILLLFLGFLRNARIRARIGAWVTEFVDYLRGVRQGACESPRPQFLTYVDDIFDDLSQNLGVEIPHISGCADVNDWIKKANGLSFADDTVAVSSTVAGMWLKHWVNMPTRTI